MIKKQILVVDDDADFAESIGQLLEDRGFQVETAHSGEEAISISRRKSFDITFMDVKLPNINGVDCFAEIKKFRPHVKTVIMTAYSMASLLEKARTIGAFEILEKPVDPRRLLDIVKEISQ